MQIQAIYEFHVRPDLSHNFIDILIIYLENQEYICTFSTNFIHIIITKFITTSHNSTILMKVSWVKIYILFAKIDII